MELTVEQLEEQLIELQTRFAYQEHLLQELNGVVTTQQRQIDRLVLELARIRDHLKQGGGEIARPHEEAPPPHY